jgi:ABC-type glycerol-3-phosphate transport system substrate-binding protein
MYYRSGGTWVGAYKGTKNPAAVKEFIRYVATDDVFLEAYAKATGDLVSNWDVIDKIKGTYSEPFLNGQNHYAFFAEAARGVNGALAQSTDDVMRESFQEAVVSYINGEKTKDQALADFRSQISSTLGL